MPFIELAVRVPYDHSASWFMPAMSAATQLKSTLMM